MKKLSLDEIVTILQSQRASDDEVCDAAHQIFLTADRRAATPLIQRLAQSSDSYWVRAKLVNALSVLRLAEATDLLLDIFSSRTEHTDVRGAAAIALGGIADPRAVEPILETLKSGDSRLSYACVAALGEIGDPRAVDSLVEALKMDDVLAPQAAAEALGRIGSAAMKALPELQNLAETGSDAQKRFALEAISRIRKSV